jgi:fumarate reductase flavoprotein subunit
MTDVRRGVDLCVVGGAGAGLCAAVRAAQLGVERILVIDKQPRMGGCTVMAGGVFSVESPVQKRQGTQLSADEVYAFHMDMTNWEPDARLVRKWMTGTGRVIGWLEDYAGVEFVKAVAFSGPVDAYHMTEKSTGREIVNRLLDTCAELGVELVNNVRAYKLVVGEGGRVNGVLARRGDEEWHIETKAVIIATGSISANRDLIQRFYGGENDMSHVRIMANVPHNTGDGLLMAEEIGAADTPMASLYIGPHNYPHNSRIGLIVRRPHTVKVNRDGERFTDEGMPLTRTWGWMMSVSLDRQPEKLCYGIVDESIIEFFQQKPKNYTAFEYMQGFQPTAATGSEAGDVKMPDPAEAVAWIGGIRADIAAEVAAGRAWVCGSSAEVAAVIGCDAAVVEKTITDYNRFCAQGHDDDFLKDKEYLLPLAKPPYYVFKAYQGIDTCLGGLRIDHNQRVVNKELRAIPGLYAAGVVAGGWLGRNYGFFGSEMSFVTYSGYAAGENAAKEVLS